MEDKNLTTNKDNEQLTPAELIKKHSSNLKHIISDNEMKNLKVGDEAEDQKKISKEIDAKESEDDLSHREPRNPYDILD